MRTSVTFMSYTALVAIVFSANDHIKALNQFQIEHMLCADAFPDPDFVSDLLSATHQAIQHFARVPRDGIYATFFNVQPVMDRKRTQNYKASGPTAFIFRTKS